MGTGIAWSSDKGYNWDFINQSTDDIGFRCAMDRVGAPISQQKENARKGVDYSKKRR